MMMENKTLQNNQLKTINEDVKSQVDKLNATKDDTGMWQYTEEYGIVWLPTEPKIEGAPPTQPTNSPTPLLEGLVEWAKTMDFNSLTDNGVLMIKIGIDDPQYASKMQYGVIKQVLEPRIQILKDKKITVLFMSTQDDISSITSEEMEQAGWVKKDKPLIVNPYEK